MKNLILLFVLLVQSALFAQEVPNAQNFVGSYKNTFRADGKYEANTPQDVKKLEQVSAIEKKILELRKSGNQDLSKVINLQKQIDAITGQVVTLPAGYYGGSITP